VGNFLIKIQTNSPIQIDIQKGHQPYFIQENSDWKVIQIGHSASKEGSMLNHFDKAPFLAPEKIGKDCAYLAHRKADNTIFVARDPFGFIPIRYTRTGNAWIIWNGPKIPKNIYKRVNYERLSGFIAHRPDRLEEGYFVGIHRILPGHIVSFSKGRHAKTTSYRTFCPDATYTQHSIDVCADSLRHALKVATPDSDLLALSGGLDSSAILVGMKKPKSFTMFSANFPSADERKEVALLSDAFNLNTTYFNVDPNLLWRDQSKHPFNEENYAGYGPIFHPPVWGEQAFFHTMAKSGTGPIITGIGGDNALDVSTQVVARRLLKKGDFKALRCVASTYPSVVAKQMFTTPMRALLPQKIKLKSNFRRDFPWLDYPLKAAQPFSQHWGEARRDRILSWSWEQVTRLLDSHSRVIGRSILSPWMSSQVWNLMVAIPPEMLFLGERHKGFLRCAMKGYLPESIRNAGKSKHFGKPVEAQLLRFQKEILALFEASLLDAKNLIRASKFRTFFGGQLDEMQTHLHAKHATQTMLSWPTISAEIWLKHVES